MENVKATGRPAAHVRIQDRGGTTATIRAGINALKEMAEKCLSQKREEVDIRDLVVSLECGGSDATSGISANPLVGWVSDRIISLGATAILSETPEMIGAEHILSGRGVDPGVGEKKRDRKMLKRIMRCMWTFEGLIPPGNIEGPFFDEKSRWAALLRQVHQK